MKLYVGNLPYRISPEEFKEAFEQHGNVESATIITDRETGRSKGFGFVEMADDDAKAAIAALHDQELAGRKIIVNEARPREERPRRNFSR